eukprot:CAMPEP_0185839768 /NCGR_PEP_ID=MMETSP1353-20130828/15134_1 /TAXON_ID=1077150 /ORGANISM="Erythrolobus australicus, Strain CCMP3124" /LENGTH=454 /DNA_ID=CAMNT_0028538985 /DNA_START=108 /DNA_END=1473 /DNA_ORIENTATION=-
MQALNSAAVVLAGSSFPTSPAATPRPEREAPLSRRWSPLTPREKDEGTGPKDGPLSISVIFDSVSTPRSARKTKVRPEAVQPQTPKLSEPLVSPSFLNTAALSAVLSPTEPAGCTADFCSVIDEPKYSTDLNMFQLAKQLRREVKVRDRIVALKLVRDTILVSELVQHLLSTCVAHCRAHARWIVTELIEYGCLYYASEFARGSESVNARGFVTTQNLPLRFAMDDRTLEARFDAEQLDNIIQAFRIGMPLMRTPRTYTRPAESSKSGGTKMRVSAFTGQDAVRWLLDAGHARSRAEAILLCEYLDKTSVIQRVGRSSGSEDFKDSPGILYCMVLEVEPGPHTASQLQQSSVFSRKHSAFAHCSDSGTNASMAAAMAAFSSGRAATASASSTSESALLGPDKRAALFSGATVAKRHSRALPIREPRAQTRDLVGAMMGSGAKAVQAFDTHCAQY